MVVQGDPLVTDVVARLFAGLAHETLAELEATARSRTCRTGEVLYSADGPARAGVVASGLLRTVVPILDGRRATLAYLQPGFVYGLPTLFHPVPLRVEAVRPSVVVEMDPPTIERVARKSAELGWLISRQLAGAVLRVPAIVEEFGFKTVRQRVARHLLALALADSHDGLLVAHVKRQELAESVGSAREVVSRCLRSLSEAHLITISSASITVVDADALRQVGA